MKNKLLYLVLISSAVLAGCGDKSAQYYYDNPTELKTVINECETKVKLATTNDELDKLTSDKVCNEAMIAAAGIQIKNLKKAQLEAEKVGWSAFIQRAKKILVTKKEREAKAASEKIESAKLLEKAKKQNWKEYLNDESNIVSSCSKDDGVCITLRELWEQKTKHGKDELFTLSYAELISKEKEYCKESGSGSFTCSLWKKAKKTNYKKEFDEYVKGDESKIRKDYQLCRKNKKVKNLACKLVGSAAVIRYNSPSLINFSKDLPNL